MKWDHESAASLRLHMGYNDDVTLERTEERRQELLKMVYAQVEPRLVLCLRNIFTLKQKGVILLEECHSPRLRLLR